MSNLPCATRLGKLLDYKNNLLQGIAVGLIGKFYMSIKGLASIKSNFFMVKEFVKT